MDHREFYEYILDLRMPLRLRFSPEPHKMKIIYFFLQT